MAEQTHRLGILGGMGPQATVDFYRRLIQRTDAARDQDHVPTLIWSDTEIPDRTAALLSGRGEAVFARLLEGVRLLEAAGCTAVAIPCNTSHYFADRLQGQMGVPLLNMVRETVAVCKARGVRRPAILATDGTVQTGVYQKLCADVGLAAYAPEPELQRLVMSIIYDEIKAGETGSREKFERIDAGLRAAGCDAAILGCTELSVYRSYHSLPDFYVDAMDVLVDRCITFCGKQIRRV